MSRSPKPTESFDPFRFQAHAVPAELRAEMVVAKLPQLDPQEVEDTLPGADPSRRAQTIVSRRKVRERERRGLHGALLVLVLVGPALLVAALFALLLK
jgi:hypothetical protein